MKNSTKNILRRFVRAIPGFSLVRSNIRATYASIYYRDLNVVSDQSANSLLASRINDGMPFSAGKIGETELRVIRHYFKRESQKTVEYPKGVKEAAITNAGIFPVTDEALDRFAIRWLDAFRALDLIAVWYNFGEREIIRKYSSNSLFCRIEGLEPFYTNEPWTLALAAKRVLVVSPFTNSISQQYKQKSMVWKGHEILADFELVTLKCPLSPVLEPPLLNDWHSTCSFLEEGMSQIRFDVAIIGAGAYSIPLVARAKKLGAAAIHMGGTT